MTNLLRPTEIRALQKAVAKYPQIVAGYQYGSTVKGSMHKASDLDIGFIVSSKAGLDVPAVMIAVSDALKKSVDVTVIEASASPLLAMQMVGGRVIYQRSVSDRALIETRILKYLEDYLHLHMINQKYLAQYFK